MSLSPLVDSLPRLLTSGSYGTYAILTALGVALLARVWISLPAADALENEPPYLPYAIPWLGHTVPFVRNSHRFLTKATDHLHLRPFSIKLAGAKKYILTHPRDVQQLFKATNLTFYKFAVDHVRDVYGIQDSDDCTLLEFFEGGKTLANGTVTEGVHGWFRQTLDGTNLDSMTRRTTRSIELALEDKVAKLPIAGEREPIKVELFSWIYNVIGRAVIAASYGETFFKVNPNFMPALFEFDGNFTKLIVKVPKPFARRAYESREELVQMLMTHGADDEQGRQMRAESSPYACGLGEAQKAAGFDCEARARFTLPLIQAAFNTNTLPAIFWMIVLISVTPGLLEKVDAEIQPAFTSLGLDTDYLNAQTKCPLLHSTFYEVLRFCSATVVTRAVEESVTIGGYTLHKGVDIICPARTMQLSKEIWGEDAAKFDPYRFVNKPQEATGHDMRVFGGGYFMCPGRHFALVMIKSAVALALSHFKFGIPDGVPEMDESAPPIGTLKPLHGVKAFVSRRW